MASAEGPPAQNTKQKKKKKKRVHTKHRHKHKKRKHQGQGLRREESLQRMTKMIARAKSQANAARSRLASKDNVAVALEEQKRRQRKRTQELVASRRRASKNTKRRTGGARVPSLTRSTTLRSNEGDVTALLEGMFGEGRKTMTST